MIENIRHGTSVVFNLRTPAELYCKQLMVEQRNHG